MSLLTSIFGGTGESSSNDQDGGVFNTKVQAPLRPHTQEVPPDKPSERKKKRKRKEDKVTPVEEKEKTEGEDDSEIKGDTPKDRTIFVGNPPLKTTRKSLASLFKSCGTVESARLRSVPVVGVKVPPNRAGDQNLVKKVCVNTSKIDSESKSSVQGYVVFASKESVTAALALNNTVFPDESGEPPRRLRVDHADPSFDAKLSVFVGNLPFAAEEDSLQLHVYRQCKFDNITDIKSVRIVRDKDTFRCKGFGYILFEERSMVATALEKLNASMYLKRSLRVQVCGKRFKGRKGAAPKPSETPSAAAGADAALYPSKPKRTRANTKETATVGALRRVLGKEATLPPMKKRRARAEKKKGPAAPAPGVSKRAAAKSKVDKRVKKIEKRITKGMGKTRAK